MNVSVVTHFEWLIGIYVAMSLCTLLVYGWDKLAARANKPRIPESYLHTLALLCGWPGGWLGQRLFRHKTIKPAFQTVFWLTVMLNMMALGGLLYWDLSRLP